MYVIGRSRRRRTLGNCFAKRGLRLNRRVNYVRILDASYVIARVALPNQHVLQWCRSRGTRKI